MIGTNLLFDGVSFDINKLTDENTGIEFVSYLAEVTDMTMVDSPKTYKFPALTDDGVSGYTSIILLAESHISIHTWPEKNLLSIDIFSCKKNFDTKLAEKEIIKFFGVESYNSQVLIRKIPEKIVIGSSDDIISGESSFGPHITIDGKECNIEALKNKKVVLNVLNDLPNLLGMTKIIKPQLVPWVDKWATTPGYSGFIMIAESHISIHTFPDDDYVFVDIFSCREFDIDKTIEYVKNTFSIKKITVNLIKRGLDFPRNKIIT